MGYILLPFRWLAYINKGMSAVPKTQKVRKLLAKLGTRNMVKYIHRNHFNQWQRVACLLLSRHCCLTLQTHDRMIEEMHAVGKTSGGFVAPLSSQLTALPLLPSQALPSLHAVLTMH